MERNQTKSLEQYQHELLNKTHELHAMLEAIQHLTTNDAVQVSAACLTTLAIMGQRKVE